MAHLEFNDKIAVHGSTEHHPLARRLPSNRPIRKRTTRTEAPLFDPSLVSRTLSPNFHG